MKNNLMLKKAYAFYLMLMFLFVVMLPGCDDTGLNIVEEVLTHDVHLVTEGRYTGRLIRVSDDDGLGVTGAVALEWNGENLYMIADQGRYMYLFTVGRETGTAEKVNPSAHDMGGSFVGRGFTQVYGVSPEDMTWIPYPDHYVKGVDYSHGPHGYMLGVCPIMDRVVGIDIETGMALRLSSRDDYCLTDEDGYAIIGAGRALGYDGKDLWMWGITGRSVKQNNLGNKSFAQLYKFLSPKSAKCVTPVGSPVVYGRTQAERDEAFQAYLDGEGAHPGLPDEGEAHASTFCFDGQHLYASGIDTRRLYIVDRMIGELHFVAKWEYAETPYGLEEHPIGGYINLKKNVLAGWAPSVSALAFDGVDMYAIESFTQALYKLERR